MSERFKPPGTHPSMPKQSISKATRKQRTSRMTFTPTEEELEAWNDLQRFLTQDFRTYHHDTAAHLFFKLDRSKTAFGLFVF
jgi:hypothetical protein